MHTLRLLGGASLEGTGGTPAGRVVPRTRLALLALLALSRSRTLPRERVLAMLWPESGPDRARHLLRDATYRLREVLGDEVLLSSGDDLRLDSSLVRCDVWSFEDAAARDHLAEADSLYAGPFLDGFFLTDAPEFERWADGERQRLASIHTRVVESLATAYGRAGDWPNAISAWRRLAAAEPHNARVIVRLMEVLDASGDRAAALRLAAAHTALLAAEFGAEADVDVAAYADRLRRIPASRVVAPPESSDPAGTPVNHVLSAPAASQAPPGSPVTGRPARPWAGAMSPLMRLTSPAWWVGMGMLLLAATALVSRQRDVFARTDATVTVLASPIGSPDSSLAYLAEGLTDEVTANLAKYAAVDVRMSRATSTTGASLREVARALGVAHVVTLAVRRTGTVIDVVVNMTRVRDGRVVWSDTFRDEAGDLVRVPMRIVNELADALSAAGSSAPRGQPGLGTDDAIAHDAFLQGRYHLDRRGAASLRLARERFQDAVARDPGFARAHAGLSMSATLLTLYDRRAFPRDSMLPLAQAAAERAVALDATSSDAQAALGLALTYRGRDHWPRAEVAYREAVSRDPRNANAHGWLAELLIAQGRTEEAVRAMERATASDPLSGIHFAVYGNHLRIAGRADDAIRAGERALQLNPAVQAIWEFYGRTLVSSGRRDSGLRVFAAHAPRHPLYTYFRAESGDLAVRDSARRVFRQWKATGADRDGSVPPPVTLALAGGDATFALDLLEQALSSNPAFPLHTPLVDDIYDSLRDSVRFRNLVVRAGLDVGRHVDARRPR